MDRHFTLDNTHGYGQSDLDALNVELDALLEEIEPYTAEWYETAKRFADTVANR